MTAVAEQLTDIDDVDTETPERSVLDELEERWPSEFEIVPITELHVDHKYQRALTTLAEKIAAKPKKHMLGTLIVSRRSSGKLFVVDGQTRLRGCEKSGVIHKLACLIYDGMTVADEARLFAELQRERRNIATHERFKSDLVGKEPMAVSIAGILKEFGLEVGGKQGQIKSPAALESVWKKDHWIEWHDEEANDFTLHGPEDEDPPVESLLTRTLNVLGEAFPEHDFKAVYAAEMIRGVGRFLDGEGVSDERLIKRLRKTTPFNLKNRAGMLREGKGGGGHTSIYMADAILTEYSRRG